LELSFDRVDDKLKDVLRFADRLIEHFSLHLLLFEALVNSLMLAF